MIISKRSTYHRRDLSREIKFGSAVDIPTYLHCNIHWSKRVKLYCTYFYIRRRKILCRCLWRWLSIAVWQRPFAFHQEEPIASRTHPATAMSVGSRRRRRWEQYSCKSVYGWFMGSPQQPPSTSLALWTGYGKFNKCPRSTTRWSILKPTFGGPTYPTVYHPTTYSGLPSSFISISQCNKSVFVVGIILGTSL